MTCSPVPAGRTGTLWEMFRCTVDQAAGEIALETDADALTYAELCARAERLAARLTGGSTPVGLLASRTTETYVGYLAALRAGRTVVPLNPRSPAVRLAGTCRAADVTTLLSDSGTTAVAAGIADQVPGAELCTSPSTTGAEPVHLPAYRGSPDDIAYTLFTSGSTNEPKGVPIRHHNLGEYLAACLDRYELGPGCRVSQTYDLTFDPSVLDMFLAWGSGATLVVASHEDVLTPVSFVNRQRITHWSSVPSVITLARRMRMLTPASMPDLRVSLFMGEQLTLDQAAAWSDATPGGVVENLYGPTELTITCTGYRLPADQSAWPRTANGTVPIGSPLPHLEAVVRTADGGVGEVGELCVRGSQRFAGYLDPRDDAHRFLRGDPPMLVEVLDRPRREDWYRTGDLVRYQDGELIHLGRVDNQVKINGHRVEPEEVEAVLRRQDGVEEAVVVVIDSNGGIELHAVYTGRHGVEDELSAAVAAVLPPYMRPRRIRRVSKLPVAENGKTDRRRLAAAIQEQHRYARKGR